VLGAPDPTDRHRTVVESTLDGSRAGRQRASLATGAARPWWLRRLGGRWMPEGLRDAQIDPGRRGAIALAAAVLAAALVVSVLVWRVRPQAEPVTAPPVVAVAPDVAGSAGPVKATTPLVVAVTGRVRRPGVVTLPAGARVIDALRAAGGPLPGADLALLNLARKLADGELVVVGVPGAGDPAAPPATDGAGGGEQAPLDLNTATLAQLDTLPGVGPVLAQRILDWRTEHGRFTMVDQLGDVPGIGESRLSQLRDLVRV
jgi:competence protein ComEA